MEDPRTLVAASSEISERRQFFRSRRGSAQAETAALQGDAARAGVDQCSDAADTQWSDTLWTDTVFDSGT